MSFITSLFKPAAKVSQQAVTDVQDEGRKAKKSRSALFETAGGVMGQEIMTGGTSARDSLFGN
jgi:hypothetical protein